MKIEELININEIIFYSSHDIAKIFGVDYSTVNLQLRKRKIKPAFLKHLDNNSSTRFYSFQQVNLLLSNWNTQRNKPCILIVSNFNKVEKFIEIESKMNK